MISRAFRLELAGLADAREIALMSRDLIEVGLGWIWRPARIVSQIRSSDTLVLAAREEERLIGFAVMHFLIEDAHLNLLAVKPRYRRSGVGSHLIRWLEKSALVAGIATVHLEVRANNQAARTFYRSAGYYDVGLLVGYYGGRESAVRMAHDLRSRKWPGMISGKALWENPWE